MKKRSEMNKYQEALKNIRPKICELVAIGTHDGTEREYKYIDSEEYILLHILADKETPMKPINNKYEITLLDKILGSEQTYTCPRCRNACLEMLATNKRNINRYCYDCGQRIDWTNVRKMEEEENENIRKSTS